jgi:hypothetical protein
MVMFQNCRRLPLRFALFAGFMLGGLMSCGEGYVVEGAVLNIACADDSTKRQLMAEVSTFLAKEGFENLGRYNEMIALVQSMPAETRQQQLAQLNRERTYLNDPSRLRIIWADYTNATPKDLAILRYTPVSGPFIEIGVYEERPGGFSNAGVAFYRRFLSDMKDHFGASIFIAKEPPANNQNEYLRITIFNTIVTVFWSVVALGLSLVFTGALSYFALRKLRLSPWAKRAIFVAINAWLAAPMPYPTTWVQIPLPNLLAFPWTDLHFYSNVALYAAVSLLCSVLICTLLAVRLFKKNDTHLAAQT